MASKKSKASEHPKALYKLRTVTRISAFVILAVVIVGLLLPTNYKVERSVTIDSSKQTVMTVLLDGNALPNWMYISDGRVEAFNGVYTKGRSATIHYNKTDKVGSLTITSIGNNQLTFDVKPKPEVDVVRNVIRLQSIGGKTKVDWLIQGKLRAGLLSPYVALLANRIAGSNFERSLDRLKDIVETKVGQ
ncbi:hypothetical protein MSP8887_02814 [Marinomonas spartinae]|uniref:Polyketide cyclase / dehydrase and lipid transport n=2 Tax=Marinomonas spartinae TaxID=1792290 RepID=A0A1A8TBD3_9GAMM|nr:hypothetical protein MSP8886_01650 [Marinomonas spartinae]SBS37114.1 hypothetical protein MSP8887_02814 [Marinomonas spartinae]